MKRKPPKKKWSGSVALHSKQVIGSRPALSDDDLGPITSARKRGKKEKKNKNKKR